MCEKCEETSFAGWWDCLVAGTLIKISVFVPVPAASAALSQTVHKPVMTITCSPAWHWLTLSLYGAMLSFQLYRQQHKQRCKTSNNVSQHNNISQLKYFLGEGRGGTPPLSLLPPLWPGPMCKWVCLLLTMWKSFRGVEGGGAPLPKNEQKH